jgi:hypothetical protein
LTFTRELKNQLIDFIETYHTAMGDFPGRTKINDAVRFTDPDLDFSPVELDEFLDDLETIKSLDERGIIPPWQLENSPGGVTAEQLAAAASLTNIKDRRSDAKKLSDLGISTRKFNGWMHSRVFTEFLKVSANKLIENSEHEAHMGLLRGVNAGNQNAIKLFFEMTGRWNPAEENTVNLQMFMTKVIEIIQTHVTDPQILMALAADLQMASLETGINPKAIENVTNPQRALESISSKERPLFF